MSAILAAMALLAAMDIGEHFADKAAWSEPAVDFAVGHSKAGFVFASQKRDIVNSLKRGKVSWLGYEVWETRIYYEPNGGATRVEMSLYNKGDSRKFDIFPQQSLTKLVDDVNAKYGEGAKLAKPERTRLKTGGYSFRREWTESYPVVTLAWGAADANSAEIQYVRVTLEPKRKAKPKGATKAVSGQASAAKAKANVKKAPNGDVWVDGVPMVDQGRKGYCAAAVAERILRYYGHEVDEHEIAQQAGTDAKGGTRTTDMIETIRTVGSKRRLGFTNIVSMSGSLDDVAKDIDNYNKTAKPMKEDPISMDDFRRGRKILVGEIYNAMNPMVLKKMRTKDARFKKFMAGVKAQVDKGVPICWSVTLGVFPEAGVDMQKKGGHMRLIIGYNAKTREILYSDTWGAGHELKRMPEDWAFTITHDAFFLRPL